MSHSERHVISVALKLGPRVPNQTHQEQRLDIQSEARGKITK
jgi:hypothetical protein